MSRRLTSKNKKHTASSHSRPFDDQPLNCGMVLFFSRLSQFATHIICQFQSLIVHGHQALWYSNGQCFAHVQPDDVAHVTLSFPRNFYTMGGRRTGDEAIMAKPRFTPLQGLESML